MTACSTAFFGAVRRTPQIAPPQTKRPPTRRSRVAAWSFRTGRPGNEPDRGPAQVLAVTIGISRAVLFVLAVAVALGIVFTLAPTNADNVIVRNAFALARGAAGPFRDVFTVGDNPDRELIVNYAFAAAVYALLAVVVGKIGRKP